MFNVNTNGIQTPNVIVGMAIFAGGLLQFIAGMWEFPRGNVFGATGKLSNEERNFYHTRSLLPATLSSVMTSSKHDVYQQSKLKFVRCLVRVSLS